MPNRDDFVSASLASIPSRRDLLRQVVDSLLLQVDRLRVYLNGYGDVPECLWRPKIVVARSEDHGDRGDAGKFFWCEQAEGYEFTCDDDFVYPPDYVATLKQAIDRYHRSVVVGVHGANVIEPITSYYASRAKFCWVHTLDQDTPCHVVGTGVMAYHASEVQFCRADFKRPNMADVWVALACERAGIPRVVIAHKAGWLKYLNPPTTIYDTHLGNDQAQTEAIRSVEWGNPWVQCGGEGEPDIPPAPIAYPSESINVCLDAVQTVLECDVGHTITRSIKESGDSFYEQDLLRAIRNLWLHGTYIDVGANIGNHTVWFAKACVSDRVISFEPNPRYHRLLVKNAGQLSKVVCRTEAVGETNGPVLVTGVTGRAVPDPALEMRAATLDKLCGDEPHIALLKVDVDGNDIGVLRGAAGIIEAHRPWISVECFGDAHNRELAEFCAKYKYRVVGVYCHTPTSLLRPL